MTEIRGLQNIIGNATTLHGITPPPERDDFHTEQEYAFACEVYAGLAFWKASTRPKWESPTPGTHASTSTNAHT